MIDARSSSPLVGVRVSDARAPLLGFTISRRDGSFDLLVNGGGAVQLQLVRPQLRKRTVRVWAPPTTIVALPAVRMQAKAVRIAP